MKFIFVTRFLIRITSTFKCFEERIIKCLWKFNFNKRWESQNLSRKLAYDMNNRIHNLSQHLGGIKALAIKFFCLRLYSYLIIYCYWRWRARICKDFIVFTSIEKSRFVKMDQRLSIMAQGRNLRILFMLLRMYPPFGFFLFLFLFICGWCRFAFMYAFLFHFSLN